MNTRFHLASADDLGPATAWVGSGRSGEAPRDTSLGRDRPCDASGMAPARPSPPALATTTLTRCRSNSEPPGSALAEPGGLDWLVLG